MSETSSKPTDSPASWYPVNPFPTALEVGHVVADAGGANTDVQKAVIAHALKSSDKSGAFLARLASARYYGLIAGSRNGYRLTEDGKRYFYPASDEEKRRALLMFLKAPSLFADIIKRFDGTKLNPDMFNNVLQREFKVPPDASSRMARFFLGAAKIAGALDDQGYLRYVAARQTVAHMPAYSTPTADTESASSSEIPSNGDESGGQQRLNVTEEASNSDGGVWRLNGTTVRLETSGKLSDPLWNLLNAYVQALKPAKEAKKT